MTEKVLDIIIPAYEAHETLSRCLCSIGMQTFLPHVQVTIVNDCSPSGDYKEIIEHFGNFMDIQELTLSENGGPGVARQYGLDNTNCPYIMFLDADDTLVNSCSLMALVDCIIANKANVLYGNFFSEGEDKSLMIYNKPNLYLHGKMYARDFLNKYHISFNTRRLYEDSYFQGQVDFFIKQLRLPTVNFEEEIMIYHHNPDGIYQGIAEDNYKSVVLKAWIENIEELVIRLDAENLFDTERFHMACIVEFYLDYNYTVLHNSDFVDELKQLIHHFKTATGMAEINIDLCKEIYTSIMNNPDMALIQGTNVREIVVPVIGFEDFIAQIV